MKTLKRTRTNFFRTVKLSFVFSALAVLLDSCAPRISITKNQTGNIICETREIQFDCETHKKLHDLSFQTPYDSVCQEYMTEDLIFPVCGNSDRFLPVIGPGNGRELIVYVGRLQGMDITSISVTFSGSRFSDSDVPAEIGLEVIHAIVSDSEVAADVGLNRISFINGAKKVVVPAGICSSFGANFSGEEVVRHMVTIENNNPFISFLSKPGIEDKTYSYLPITIRSYRTVLALSSVSVKLCYAE